MAAPTPPTTEPQEVVEPPKASVEAPAEAEALAGSEPQAPLSAEPQAASAEPQALSAEQAPPEAVSATEPSAVVPVGSLRQERQRTSFWKRIRLRGRSALDPATRDDRMIARLDAIASRIETSQQQIGERIQLLDQRFSEVWEVEEQLSRLMELREMLEDLQERQGRIDGRQRSLERRLSFLTLLAGAAAAAAIAAVTLMLL